MSLLIALIGAWSAVQGQVIEVVVPDEAGLTTVTATWNDRSVPLVPRAAEWFTVLGIDLEQAPGEQPLKLIFQFDDGRRQTRASNVTVRGKTFPIRQLTVAAEYVDLSEENQARTAREREEINAIYAKITPQAMWTEPFTTPVPGVSGGRNFGQRRVFNDQSRAPHSGTDLTAKTGTPIHAANRGQVVLAKNLFFSGNAVFIDHGLGIYSVYLHLSEIRVAAGQRVGRGQIIGLAGATGRVTGAHLHWGVRAQGARVDPFSLLEVGVGAR
ncbi:MAG: M23 family metallopeptidase [Gammaproteobacteria bacterium]|nr:MAG: M23 family metallopeptidase [Gammaproteobacteria bacterium]